MKAYKINILALYTCWYILFSSFLIALSERITYFSNNLPITLNESYQIILILIYLTCLWFIRPWNK